MAEVILYVPFDAISTQFLTATHNIVRHVQSTFDVAAQNGVGTRTGWDLETAPAGVTINESGLLTFDVNHISAFDADTIIATTNEGAISVPVTIRNWFPEDGDADVWLFYSAWRSRDATSRTLWSGTYTWRDEGFTYTSDITGMSGDDGYLDLEGLRQELANRSDDGILYVTQIQDQGANNAHITGEANESFFAVQLIDGQFSDTTIIQNGNLMFRSNWRLREGHSAWSNDLIGAELDDRTTPLTFPTNWAMIVLQRRFGTAGATDNRVYRVGDENSYKPGIRDNGNNVMKFNAGGTRPSDLTIDFALNNYFLTAYSVRPQSGSPYARSLASWDMTTSNTEENNASSGSSSGGGGVEIELGDYYWAEMANFRVPEADGNQGNLREYLIEGYINGGIAVFHGGTTQYS